MFLQILLYGGQHFGEVVFYVARPEMQDKPTTRKQGVVHLVVTFYVAAEFRNPIVAVDFDLFTWIVAVVLGVPKFTIYENGDFLACNGNIGMAWECLPILTVADTGVP